jgi:hypothetical protein
VFERAVRLPREEGVTAGFIDLFKRGAYGTGPPGANGFTDLLSREGQAFLLEAAKAKGSAS